MIPNTAEAEARLAECRDYISLATAKDAYDMLVASARVDGGYSFEPRKHGAIERTVKYLIGRQYVHAIIVNRNDLLFYYRQPCGKVNDAKLKALRDMGLDANYALHKSAPKSEITVRLVTVEQAQQILNDCFGAESVGTVEDAGGSDWSDDELRASIEAYREMQDLEREGQARFKAQIYRRLSERFGRTVKAFEFRMQNISAVLSLLGREWIEGLKPAAHVGAGVAARLESLINELDGFELIPRVAFEIAVRDQIERPPTIAPLGTLAPGRTITTSTSVIRDAAVKAWVIGRANGVCECCGCPAPFESTVGIGFLEVHHLKTLADGGSDTISNAAAVCPNCHRRMHFGKDAAAMKNQTTARVPGLKLE